MRQAKSSFTARGRGVADAAGGGSGAASRAPPERVWKTADRPAGDAECAGGFVARIGGGDAAADEDRARVRRGRSRICAAGCGGGEVLGGETDADACGGGARMPGRERLR